MFLMGNEWVNLAPKATVPKSCVVLLAKSLSAHAPVGAWERVGPTLKATTVNANANFLMLVTLDNCRTLVNPCR